MVGFQLCFTVPCTVLSPFGKLGKRSRGRRERPCLALCFSLHRVTLPSKGKALAQGHSAGPGCYLQAQGRYCLLLLEAYFSFLKGTVKVWSLESSSGGWSRLWQGGVALPGPHSPRGPYGTCFSWERSGENSRGPVAKHRNGIMEGKKEDGDYWFLCAPDTST